MTSCSDEKDPIKEVKAPSTYTFSRDAKSTVSYSGQQTRLDMHT
ncbi:DUF4856 domain-containing protein, partial [Tenacibaculum finnmarkense]